MHMGLLMLGRKKNTAEPLVPGPSAFEVEMAMKSYKDTNH
jgi:hypothetical protein